MTNLALGEKLYQLAHDLFPINRSITGPGVRQTLDIINTQINCSLNIHEVATGTQVFDWQIPKEWSINQAWIKNSKGEKIVDFATNNLHVVGYSTPVDTKLSLTELKAHLHSLPEQPTAIPYVTSYYKERWGFCLRHDQLEQLVEDDYHVYIESSLFDGSLTYADTYLPGETEQEILLSTYVCHPSMANNELSGPLIAISLFNWIASLPKRKYSYRFVFAPETIGAITYLSKHVDELKDKVKAGFVLTCLGDDNDYSMLASRYADNLSDNVARAILEGNYAEKAKFYSFLERGSDERQFCAPGIDLPIATIMRTKYAKYAQYHTSLDNLDFISPQGLAGGFEFAKRCIELLEKNETYMVQCLGEPQLSKHDLYPTTSIKNTASDVRNRLNVLAYCDGTNDLLSLAKLTNIGITTIIEITDILEKKGIIKAID